MGNDATKDYLIGQPRTWIEFQKAVKELKAFEEPIDAIVVDVLNQLWPRALGSSGSGGETTQADWAQMGNDIRNVIELLRELAPTVYVVLDVLPDDEGNDKLDLNRDLYKKIISLFGTKTYCYTRSGKDKTGKSILTYSAQENGAKALDLRPESK